MKVCIFQFKRLNDSILICLLYTSLQEALLVDVDLIELIDVDEQKASQTALRFLPTLEVDAVRIRCV